MKESIFILLMSSVITGCSLLVPDVGFGKHSSARIVGGLIVVDIDTLITFDRSIELEVSRLVDFIQSKDGGFKNGTPPELLQYLINTPYEILGEKLSTKFLPAQISRINRNKQEAFFEYTLTSEESRLNELPTDAPSLPALLNAKSADNYRWKIDSEGKFIFTLVNPRVVRLKIISFITTEQLKDGAWQSPNRDWVSWKNLRYALNEVQEVLKDEWVRQLERKVGLESGSIQVRAW